MTLIDPRKKAHVTVFYDFYLNFLGAGPSPRALPGLLMPGQFAYEPRHRIDLHGHDT